MYTQRVILRICFSVLHVGRGETRHCIAMCCCWLVRSGRPRQWQGRPTRFSTDRAQRYIAYVSCTRRYSNGKRCLPKRKKVSTLTSDDAVTCQNIPGSPSAFLPGDEASTYSRCFYDPFGSNNIHVTSSLVCKFGGFENVLHDVGILHVHAMINHMYSMYMYVSIQSIDL